jgi:hypothetical protein
MKRQTDMKPRAIWLITRAIGAVILLTVLSACAGAATTSAKDSGIQGKAIYGPTCPVQRIGGPSCQRPYSGQIVIHQGDRTITTIRSAADGTFRVALPPGAYTISSAGTGLPVVKPFDVTVKPHTFTTITVMFDSGIR